MHDVASIVIAVVLCLVAVLFITGCDGKDHRK